MTNSDYQLKQENLRLIRLQIIKDIKEAISNLTKSERETAITNLKDAREKCEVSRLWNYGHVGKEIDRVIGELEKSGEEISASEIDNLIISLDELSKGIPIPTPDI